MTKVTLYAKPGCCLCDDARAMLERIGREREFELEEVDISGDRGLQGRYGDRIPVVLLDGVPVFELRVDEPELLRRLAPTLGSAT